MCRNKTQRRHPTCRQAAKTPTRRLSVLNLFKLNRLFKEVCIIQFILQISVIFCVKMNQWTLWLSWNVCYFPWNMRESAMMFRLDRKIKGAATSELQQETKASMATFLIFEFTWWLWKAWLGAKYLTCWSHSFTRRHSVIKATVIHLISSGLYRAAASFYKCSAETCQRTPKILKQSLLCLMASFENPSLCGTLIYFPLSIRPSIRRTWHYGSFKAVRGEIILLDDADELNP